MGEIIRGRVWKFGDDINTDLMMPAIALLLPEAQQRKYCFSANRPGWLDQVSELTPHLWRIALHHGAAATRHIF